MKPILSSYLQIGFSNYSIKVPDWFILFQDNNQRCPLRKIISKLKTKSGLIHSYPSQHLKAKKKSTERQKTPKAAVIVNVVYRIGHFTVVCLVTWPLSGSEAGGDLVLIQTLLLFTCKSCCSHAN